MQALHTTCTTDAYRMLRMMSPAEGHAEKQKISRGSRLALGVSRDEMRTHRRPVAIHSWLRKPGSAAGHVFALIFTRCCRLQTYSAELPSLGRSNSASASSDCQILAAF